MINKIKEDIIKYNIDYMSDMDILTILIGKAAVEGLKEKGILSISELSIMSNDEILSVSGMGKDKLAKVTAIIELGKRGLRKNNNDNRVKSPADTYKACLDMKAFKQEVFRVLYLDSKNSILASIDLFKGTLNSSTVHPREIFKEAFRRSAASIILCHNHPSGDPTPSNEDILITKRIVESGKIIGIEVIDHVIIGDYYISLKEKMVF